MRYRTWASFLGAALLLSGCGLLGSGDSAVFSFRLQPYPPVERSDSAPFGLYASPPSADTLASLQSATLSPDGRFRAARSVQGVWIARADGAWYWQVVEKPGPSQFSWTKRGTLIVADDAGTWHEAVPSTGLLQPVLAEALRTKARQVDSFSPDGRRVAYRVPGPKGFTIWVAWVDGTGEARLAENAAVLWRPDGTPEAVPLEPAPGRPRELESGRRSQ